MMQKRALSYLFFSFVAVLLLVSVVSAVWYNPNTWFESKNNVRLSPPAENSIFVNAGYLGQLNDTTAPYSFSPGDGNDFTFSLQFNSASGVTIQRMSFSHTGYTNDEYWRTYGNLASVYPLVIFDSSGNKINNVMVEPVLTVSSGVQNYRFYIQPGYNIFMGGALTIILSNGDAVTLNIPAGVGQTVSYGTYGQGGGGNPNACTSFTYGDWTPATCSYGSQQTRTVTGSPAGCTGGSPEGSSSTCPTCTDSDADSTHLTGLNFGVFGTATYSAGISQSDYCGSPSAGHANILFESYCRPSDGTPSTEYYSCEYGCASGRCLDAPVVASCTDLNVTTKALINSRFVYNSATGKWADSDGDLLHLNSNDWVNKSQYVILVADNGRQGIYEITQLTNSSSTTIPSDDEITLKDMSTGASTTAKAITEGAGNITLLGASYQYNYRGTQIIPERSRQVKFNSMKDYSSCSIYTAPTCTDSDGGLNYNVKGYTNGTDANGNKGIATDTCVDSSPAGSVVMAGPDLVEVYCDNSLASERRTTCPNGCYDGACVYGANQEISLTNVNNIANFNLGNDLMKVKLLAATDVSATIEIIDGQEGVGAEITEGTSKVIGGVNVYLVSVDENTALNSISAVVVLSLEQVCKEYIADIKNPSDFIKSGLAFELDGNGSYTGSEWVKGGSGYKEYSYDANYANWRNNHDGKSYYFGKTVKVFDDVSFDVKKIFDEIIESGLCVEREFNGESAYICAYNGLTGSNDYNSIIWFNDNVMVVVDVAIWAKAVSNSDINEINDKNLNSLVRDIQNNQYKDISENFELDSVFNSIVGDDLQLCSSDVSNDGGFTFGAYCKIEPVVCPEYGRQVEKCYRYVNGKEVVNEKQLYCSPGVCSGCMVPRWMGYDFAGSKTESVCIPYGTRLANSQDSGSERIYEGYYTEGDKEYLNLTIFDTSSGYLDLDIDGAVFKGEIYESAIVDAGEIIFTVKEIFTSEEEGDNDAEGYIEISIVESFDAYCKYDGDLYEQKGDDAECQNNYECSSNECRTGQCVNTYVGVSQNTNILVKIICRIVNIPPFGDEDSYNQCLLEYAGGSDGGTSSGGSNGGGSGGSSA